MTSRHRPLGPRAGIPPDVWTPLAILALLAGVTVLALGGWAAGAVAHLLAARRWAPPPLESATLHRLVAQGPEQVFAAPLWLLVALWALLLVGLAVPVAWLWRRSVTRPASDDPLRSLARPADLAVMCPDGVTARARALRPGLPRTGPIAPADTGVLLGRLEPGGPQIRASWEDVMVAIMAPRAGKSTALAVPAVLAAPGPVIATSNKADLLTATFKLRAAASRCWVFDPQGIAHAPRRFSWNPLAGITTVQEASRLAGHFGQEVKGENRTGGDFWTSAAEDLLTSLILAAALDGRDLAQVFAWLNQSSAPLPRQLLRSHGHPAAASSLEGRQGGATETREGIYETARTAAQCLRDPQIMAWVSPDPGLPTLDPAAFVASRDTVYAMSKDGGGSAAPLVAALVDGLMRAGIRHAEAHAGRMDPPLVAALDEAANCTKISDLPLLYSHLGSRGIAALTILQSYEQGKGVWGATGMDTMWGAATVKLIGAGIDDPKLAEDISKLVGEHDVVTRSTSHGRDVSSSLSLRRQRILPPEAVRALPRGRALLLATGQKPGMLRLLPWYDTERAGEISRNTAAAERAIRSRARQLVNAVQHEEAP